MKTIKVEPGESFFVEIDMGHPGLNFFHLVTPSSMTIHTDGSPTEVKYKAHLWRPELFKVLDEMNANKKENRA